MNKHIFCICLIVISFQLYGGNNPPIKKNLLSMDAMTSWLDSSSHEAGGNIEPQTFQFSEVDAMIKNGLVFTEEDNLADVQVKAVEYAGNPKVIAAKKAIEGLDPARLIRIFTGSELVKLPVGIKQEAGGYTYSIVFEKAEIHPEYAQLTVYAGVFKEGEMDLLFGSDDIKFSYDGGIIGDASLALFADYPIKRESKKLAFLFKAFQRNEDGNHGGCYVNFDCNGFVAARIDGDIIISRDWVLPTNQYGKVIEGGQRVAANLALTVSDMNDFVVEASLPYFTITSDTSITVLVDKAVVDFSDTKSAVGFRPPPEYNEETGEIDDNPDNEEYKDLWKGVFFRKIEIVLPDVFDQEDAALAIGAEHLYIDSKGVTGVFYVNDPLPLEKGKIGNAGWAFAIDHIEMSMIYSKVIGFGFDGRVAVPIGGEAEALLYGATADIAREVYNFNIGVDSTMRIPMWDVVAVDLKKGTKLNINVNKGKFRTQAVLCGNLNISVQPSDKNKNTDLTIGDVIFEQLIVQDTLPYVTLGADGGHVTFLVGPQLNNSILNVDYASILRYEETKVMFAIGMEAGPMSEGDGGAKTSGSFGMVAEPTFVNGKQKWEFVEMKLMSLEIHLDFADAGYIKGGITFFADDPTYGNGFEGHLEGGFVKTDSRYKFSAAASARFGTMNEGKKDEFKYWSFDVYVSSTEVAIPIYPPIAANGFGGGMYHHMSMTGYDLDLMAENGLTNPYSGIIYEPDTLTRLGLKATIGLTTTSGKAFQGVVTLEISFNQNLGLREIKLYGTGEIAGSDTQGWTNKQKDGIVSNVKERTAAAADNETAAKGKANTISCAVMMRVSLVDGFLLHGNFNVYVDAGEGKITGEGKLDLLVSVPKDPATGNQWHMYIGGYADNSISNIEGEKIPPVSVKINFKAFSLTASLYLMMGNDLPGPPPLSPQLAAVFGSSANEVNRGKLNEGGRSAGNATGAAFGNSMEVSFTYRHRKNNGKLAEWRYINVNGGAGFDIALLSFNDNSRCSIANNFPHGQKGWRAYGRVYLYASVEGYWLRANKIDKQFIAFKVEGDIPNPAYFNIDLVVKIFGILDLKKNIELGDKCGNVQS